MTYFLTALGIIVLGIVLVEWVRIFEYQRGLKYSRGRFAGILGPGQYLLFRPFSSVTLVDMRERFVTISGQGLVTSDGVQVKLSLAASYTMADPAKAINEIQDYEGALYLKLQLALWAVVSATSSDELLEKRADIASELKTRAADSAEALGLALRSAEVKDVMLPGEVKRVFMNVVKARKEGQAALERARGESAAMRNLANIAALLEAHPLLLQVRAVQQLAGSENSTLVLGLPQGSQVIPTAAKPTAADGRSPEQDESEQPED